MSIGYKMEQNFIFTECNFGIFLEMFTSSGTHYIYISSLYTYNGILTFHECNISILYYKET